MAEITPKPRTGVIVKFGAFPSTTINGPITPKPRTGVIVRFSAIGSRRAHHNLGLVRGARGVG